MKRGTGVVNPALFPKEEFDLYSIPAYDNLVPEKLLGTQIGSSKKVVQECDVLLSRIVPHIQRSWIVGPSQGRRQIGSSEWIIFDGSKISAEYLRYFLLSYDFHQKFMKTISGVGGSLTRANPNLTAEFSFPLPPLPEQHRIVAKIEELFASLDKGIEALKTAQQQLKVYRQAVLKYAFEGKLTHPELKEGELPEGWVLTTLQSLTTKIVDGAHHTPTYTKQGVPFISVKDIRNFEIDFSNTKFIDRSTHNELIKRCNPEVGDILITKSGTIGRLAIVPNAEFSLFVSVALLKIKQDLIESKFALYSIQNHINHLDISSEIKGGLLKNYHLEDLRKASICYVPQAQQEQVVKEIESRLSVCDKIDEIIVTNLQQSEALRQSILKKAFEGKLVPQDPNDEPASVLLERIRAGRVASAPLNKPVAKKGRRVKA